MSATRVALWRKDDSDLATGTRTTFMTLHAFTTPTPRHDVYDLRDDRRDRFLS